MPDMEYTSDVLVIGAGPAGCTAALYAARAKLHTVMSSPTALAGTMARAPRVANFPGQIEPVPGRDLLARMREQALNAGAEHILESIQAVDFSHPEAFLVYGGHQEHRVRAVIIATGALGRAQKVPGEEEFIGRGVAYCAACDGPFFAGEDIIVVGQDEEAIEEAVSLAQIARTVTLVLSLAHIPPESQDFLKSQPNISWHTGLRLERIVGDNAVTGAVFRAPDGTEKEIPAAGVFIYLKGNAPATDFLQGALATDEEGFLITDELCQTSIPGVFAAGDVRSKPLRQIVIAAAEGAIAALAAERHIRKSDKLRWDRG